MSKGAYGGTKVKGVQGGHLWTKQEICGPKNRKGSSRESFTNACEKMDDTKHMCETVSDKYFRD
jgi:hypothetical protein